MKTKLLIATLAAALTAASVFLIVAPAQAAVGLRITNGRLVEANGTPFIMRGTSHAHVWYQSQTSSFANIKSLGANTVRVVLSGGRWTPVNGVNDVRNVVSLCKTNRLICVLENHDTTGYGEQQNEWTLDRAVDYWISVQAALTGEENYVLINIGNEPYGNNNPSGWTQATINAIGRMRTAGFDHTLVVDAPNWGQDWQFIMRDNAPAVFNSDVDRNTLFSVHMYGVFNTAQEVIDYLQSFQTRGLPLIVGEFGHNHSDGDPDEDTIMAQTVQRNIGYLGWSWSGNSGGVEYLDQVTNFNVNQLTSWGQRLFNGANGIRATSRQATIYGNQPSPSVSPTRSPTPSPSTSPSNPGGRTCTATYTKTGQWQGGFQGEVRVTAGSSAITGWRVTWTWANGQSITQYWGANVSGAVTATNLSYNGSLGAGQSTTWGFLGSWNNSVNNNPTPTCVAS
ncbi:cellulase family glycosylhydrolase [Allorhizocola rhizosphaerae]|uniref:cellulase family glycosylhydrolase n=1 Tax=Allorhizocola rhizosphaerae TaxID=1872709 RepID=UPI000E3E1F6E|nr:cellulase family glycosylhydrolase [Allorhizocola rhizosphaerae]